MWASPDVMTDGALGAARVRAARGGVPGRVAADPQPRRKNGCCGARPPRRPRAATRCSIPAFSPRPCNARASSPESTPSPRRQGPRPARRRCCGGAALLRRALPGARCGERERARRRLRDAPPAQGLLLRGFAALSPRLAALAPGRAWHPRRSAAPAAQPCAACAQRMRVAQMEAIAGWCQARLSARPDARLLVMFPGPAGARERLAALILTPSIPAALAAPHPHALVGIEGGEPFGALPCPRMRCRASTFLLALSSIRIHRPLAARPIGERRRRRGARRARAAAAPARPRGPRPARAPRRAAACASRSSSPLRVSSMRGCARPSGSSARKAPRRAAGPSASRRHSGRSPGRGRCRRTAPRIRRACAGSELLEEFGELAGSVPTLRWKRRWSCCGRWHAHRVPPRGSRSPVTLSPHARRSGRDLRRHLGRLARCRCAAAAAQRPTPSCRFRHNSRRGLARSERGGPARPGAERSSRAWRRRHAGAGAVGAGARWDLRAAAEPVSRAARCRGGDAAAAVWLPLRLHREGCHRALQDAARQPVQRADAAARRHAAR